MIADVHTEGRRHDCAHVEWRDGLVPVAAAIADARHGAAPVDGSTKSECADWRRRWDATYHREMQRLAADPFIRARHGKDAVEGGAS